MGVYEELGVRRVINASGTMTHLGGSIPDPRVMDAMKEASQSFVIMMELLEKAGEVVAEATGAEAGMVACGSSAALVLGTAACIMRGSGLEGFDVRPVERLDLDGEWRELVQRLPDASWTRDEVIIQRVHRNAYDHAFQAAGGRLVVVGTDEGCSPEALEEAITERTAAIAFTARMEDDGVPLREVAGIARKHGVPVIVDAAAELPPRANLRRYLDEGADLVAFSGGKHMGGPNDTGILCGRRDLIKLATLQGPPYRGIGRGMKVDRTQVVGLITALRLWLEVDEEAEFQAWEAKARWMAEDLRGAPRVSRSEVVVNERRRWAHARITLEEGEPTAEEVVFELRRGSPSVWMNHLGSNRIEMDPSLLREGEEKRVVSALEKALSCKPRRAST